MTPEHALSNRIRLWCGENDILCFHINVGKIKLPSGGYFQTGVPNGWPDLLMMTKGGKVFFVETKTLTGNLEKDQAIMINELRKRKFEVHIIFTFTQFEYLIEQLKQKAFFD